MYVGFVVFMGYHPIQREHCPHVTIEKNKIRKTMAALHFGLGASWVMYCTTMFGGCWSLIVQSPSLLASLLTSQSSYLLASLAS